MFSSCYICICSLLHGTYAYVSLCGIVLISLYVFNNLFFFTEDEKLLELDLDDVLQQTYDLKQKFLLLMRSWHTLKTGLLG